MHFTPTQEMIFGTNLQAIEDEFLKTKLSQIKSTSYTFMQGNDVLDINLENVGGGKLYQNPLSEVQSKACFLPAKIRPLSCVIFLRRGKWSFA
ncbi:hypothetical protein [Campylobacter helveticus]|uniref:hypothetical protein n=1 Tax=Campylobacter helveticus TaxID=28898 RepID=UPI0022EB676D|nr:hypothetical protein [Campylobacter helveticus]